jgi:hypothetical protein
MSEAAPPIPHTPSWHRILLHSTTHPDEETNYHKILLSFVI